MRQGKQCHMSYTPAQSSMDRHEHGDFLACCNSPACEATLVENAESGSVHVACRLAAADEAAEQLEGLKMEDSTLTASRLFSKHDMRQSAASSKGMDKTTLSKIAQKVMRSSPGQLL